MSLATKSHCSSHSAGKWVWVESFGGPKMCCSKTLSAFSASPDAAPNLPRCSGVTLRGTVRRAHVALAEPRGRCEGGGRDRTEDGRPQWRQRQKLPVKSGPRTLLVPRIAFSDKRLGVQAPTSHF